MTEWHTETLNLREVAAGRTTSEIRLLIHFWTIELASLDQTKHLIRSRENRAYFGGLKRKDFRKGWEGSPTATCTTAIKTLNVVDYKGRIGLSPPTDCWRSLTSHYKVHLEPEIMRIKSHTCIYYPERVNSTFSLRNITTLGFRQKYR